MCRQSRWLVSMMVVCVCVFSMRRLRMCCGGRIWRLLRLDLPDLPVDCRRWSFVGRRVVVVVGSEMQLSMLTSTKTSQGLRRTGRDY